MRSDLKAIVLAGAVLLPLGATAQVPRLVRLTEIGCESCGGATQFAELLDVALTDSGGVLVTGNEAPILRMFDRNGKVAWTSGTDGMGPGEFRRPMRAMVGPGGVQVLDMTQRRVTRLGTDGRYISSAPLTGFPAALAAQGRSGSFVALIDDFRGGKTLQRWTATDSGSIIGALPPIATPPQPGVITFSVLAASPGGTMALVRDINAYRIERLTADGKVTGTIARDIPQVARTEAEMAAQERSRQRASARVRAEQGRARTGQPVRPSRVGGDPELKPHIAIDGLRFDDGGRLWVRTLRGDESFTVFDLFAPGGNYLGEVKVEGVIGAFSLAGRWLAAATTAEEGFAVVRVYEVR